MSRPRPLFVILGEAREAWAAGERETCALALREAWRASRNPALARLYERFVRPAFDASLGVSPEARAERFRALARAEAGSPLALSQLLSEPHNPALAETERLELLRPWTPDPLLASGLAEGLLFPRLPELAPSHRSDQIRRAQLLRDQGDPRQLRVLETLASEPGLHRSLRAMIERLESVRARRLDDRSLASLAPIERQLETRASTDARGAALLDAVLADPESDAARLVHADWLSEHGDPRGEFITLQISRGPSAPPSKRERELLAAYAPRWVAPLDVVLSPHSWVFERGFLAQASIEAPRLQGPVLTSDGWRTLRVLDGHVPDLLVLGGCLEQLETLYGFLDLERFVALRADGHLQSVLHYECSLADPNLRFDTPLGLRSLLVRRALNERLVTLLRSPACRSLDEFAAYYELDPKRAPADHRERPHLRERLGLLLRALPPHVSRLRMLDARTSRASRPRHIELLFERAPSGELSRLRVTAHPSEAGDPIGLVRSLEATLAALTEVGYRARTLQLVVDPALDAIADALEQRAHQLTSPPTSDASP